MESFHLGINLVSIEAKKIDTVASAPLGYGKISPQPLHPSFGVSCSPVYKFWLFQSLGRNYSVLLQNSQKFCHKMCTLSHNAQLLQKPLVSILELVGWYKSTYFGLELAQTYLKCIRPPFLSSILLLIECSQLFQEWALDFKVLDPIPQIWLLKLHLYIS